MVLPFTMLIVDIIKVHNEKAIENAKTNMNYKQKELEKGILNFINNLTNDSFKKKLSIDVINRKSTSEFLILDINDDKTREHNLNVMSFENISVCHKVAESLNKEFSKKNELFKTNLKIVCQERHHENIINYPIIEFDLKNNI